MDENPSVLFLSCSEAVTPDEIIHSVISSPEPPKAIAINEDIDAYPYHIDNKYYTTDINLCSLKRKTISNGEFASTVQGTVIYFDSTKNNCLSLLDSWLPFLNEYEAEIKMLVCKNCLDETDEGCSKRLVQEWCIGKGFELVELEPIVEVENEDNEDDFQETTGIKRIVQALNAHIWPNLVLKNSEVSSPIALGNDSREINSNIRALTSQLLGEEGLDEFLDSSDQFSGLFSQLSELKARIATLDGSDRIEAARNIVHAFWEAMDGRDDEDIFDL